MLPPIGDYFERVVTRLALDLFERQARELCAYVRLRVITWGEAIEILEVKPAYNQIVRYCGPQRAEQLMAKHLKTEVPA
ncbi:MULTISPECIES: hypothetical protein [unclassified Bradyrhizobium]|uniref:hypothetical protein n=1 Tax=unclassified Bradyrhizobium TaxID=2631580 RepID=UPI00291600E5|nr:MULTISPECIES: hypothetical protein [unclassified Bradyrhizobium]